MVLLVLVALAVLCTAAGLAVDAMMRTRRRLGEDHETIPHEDLHPVVSYLHAMCGVPGLVIGDFALAGSVWLMEGRLAHMPVRARRLSTRDRAGLPPPYAQRPPAAAPAEPPS